MRSRPQQKQHNVACQQTQRKSIRNWSMLPNITYAHTHTHTEYVILHQVLHTVFKSWNMLNPHTDAATHTHTCCDSLLYLRSAGLRWIVIDLCWWAVWGFLSSLSVLFFPHTHISTYRRCTTNAMPQLYALTVLFPYLCLSCDLRCTRRWADNLS